MTIEIESESIGEMLESMAKAKDSTPSEEAEQILRTVFLWWSDGKVDAFNSLPNNEEDVPF